MNGLVARTGAWLLGMALANAAEDRAALRRDGYVAAVDDALEVVATGESRREIIEDLRALRAEVAQ